MKTDWDFEPVTAGERYFCCFKSEDADRVGIIAHQLNQMGVPLWYDKGIIPGENWKREIGRNIRECEAVIIFVTHEIFEQEDNYVEYEYDIAETNHKSIYPVWMDDFDPRRNKGDIVKDSLAIFFEKINRIEGIKADDIAGRLPQAAARMIVERFGLINDKGIQQKTTHCGAVPTGDIKHNNKESKPVKDTSGFFKDFLSPVAIAVVASMIFLWLTGGEFLYLLLAGFVLLLFYLAWKWMSSDTKARKRQWLWLPVLALAFGIVVVFAWFVRERHVNKETTPSGGNPVVGQLKKGDRNVEFGSYPQGKYGEHESLKWRVLDVVDGKALLVTEKLIDCMPYNYEGEPTTWKDCSLRTWLNDTFINYAFNTEEQKKIISSTIINLDNIYYDTDGGEDTEDSIFLLSLKEAYHYFSDSADRMAAPTGYAIIKGASVSSEFLVGNGEGAGWWWLRSPGVGSIDAAYVPTYGDVNDLGYNVDNSGVSVRPALWLNLES